MWQAQIDTGDKDVHKIKLLENNDQLSYSDMIHYWRKNQEFRDFYISILKDSPFEAFFWENPPLTRSSIAQAYEFVLVNSPQLFSVSADPTPFSRQFHSQPDSQSVIRFQNIGGDAELVVPRPIASQGHYSHFAVFLRHAPAAQVHELFDLLADTLREKVGDQPVWVSTSGLGVYWLHVRIDQSPKYYTYQPYKGYFET